MGDCKLIEVVGEGEPYGGDGGEELGCGNAGFAAYPVGEDAIEYVVD